MLCRIWNSFSIKFNQSTNQSICLFLLFVAQFKSIFIIVSRLYRNRSTEFLKHVHSCQTLSFHGKYCKLYRAWFLNRPTVNVYIFSCKNKQKLLSLEFSVNCVISMCLYQKCHQKQPQPLKQNKKRIKQTPSLSLAPHPFLLTTFPLSIFISVRIIYVHT